LEKRAAARLIGTEGHAPAELVDWTPGRGRKFAFTLAPVFIVLAGIVWWWRDEPRVALALAAIGAILVVSGIVVPGRLGPVYRAWMGLSRAISWLTTPIVLGILYYFVITPAGLLRRMLGGNPLRHSGDASSEWASRDAPRGDLERQF